MSACTRLPYDSRPPSVPDESLAVLIRGHEIAPGTQTDDSRHGAIINFGVSASGRAHGTVSGRRGWTGGCRSGARRYMSQVRATRSYFDAAPDSADAAIEAELPRHASSD